MGPLGPTIELARCIILPLCHPHRRRNVENDGNGGSVTKNLTRLGMFAAPGTGITQPTNSRYGAGGFPVTARSRSGGRVGGRRELSIAAACPNGHFLYMNIGTVGGRKQEISFENVVRGMRSEGREVSGTKMMGWQAMQVVRKSHAKARSVVGTVPVP